MVHAFIVRRKSMNVLTLNIELGTTKKLISHAYLLLESINLLKHLNKNNQEHRFSE
jgi:hypothetical protein